MDFISNLIKITIGKWNILILFDVFSKFVKLYPTRSTKYCIVKEKLNKFFEEVGKPKCIINFKMLDLRTFVRKIT